MKITPPFDAIPEPITALAFSEAVEPGVSQSVSYEHILESGEITTAFPPEPTELLCMSGAYIHPLQGVVRRFAQLSPDLPPKNQALKLYKNMVVTEQRQMPRLLETTMHFPGIQNESELRMRALELVQQTGRMLLAGHIIGRVERTGQLVDSLILPKSVSDGIALEIRNSVAPLMAELAPDDPIREGLKPLLQMQPSSRNASSIVAASFLPDIKTMQAAFPANQGKK